MKKRYYLVIAYGIFIIILGISICKTFNPKKLGETYSSLYEPLEYYTDIIETNMSEITDGNDNWNWAVLKETNLEDEQLKNTYNSLVSDIRTCYLLSNDLENKTYSNIKVLSFKNKTIITEEELKKLNNNENCLDNFGKYNSLVLSNNQELSKKIKTQISIIIDYKLEPSTYKDLDVLLSEEMVTMNRIANLSRWLKIEYYSHKK